MKTKSKLAIKVGTYLLAGALVLGVGKLAYDTNKGSNQKFCERYGFLRNQPEEVQRDHIRKDHEERFFIWKHDHPLGFREKRKEQYLDLMVESLNKCDNSI